MFKLISRAFLLGLLVAANGSHLTMSPAAALTPAASARAEIWNTEQFVYPSVILGRKMLIQVAKPLRPQTKPVPAVYLIDGNLIFPMIATSASLAANTNQLGPAYFVGIGYPEQEVAHWARERGRDLVHADLTGKAKASSMTFGGGARYERFLVEELKPLIEARYGVDPARAVLAGYSLGGLFAAHVLINNPDAFSDYLIGSPSLWLDPKLVAAAAKLGRGKPRRVFIGVGANEEAAVVRNADSLATALRKSSSDTQVQYWAVPDENHFSVSPALFRRAWKFLLPPLLTPVPGPSNPDKSAKSPKR